MKIKSVHDLSKSLTVRNQEKIEKLLKHSITVGIHQKDNKEYENGQTTAEVGMWHEFGTSKLPARVWLRFLTMETKERQAFSDVLKNTYNSTDDIDRILKTCGEYQKNRVKDRILRNGVVPHSHNKSGITLVDTGQLVESIDYEVQ